MQSAVFIGSSVAYVQQHKHWLIGINAGLHAADEPACEYGVDGV